MIDNSVDDDRSLEFADFFRIVFFSHGQHDSADILLRKGAKFVTDRFGKTPLGLCLEVRSIDPLQRIKKWTINPSRFVICILW